ncbi:hypothetical protein EJB05_29200, partial [Eragrostis curvula]
MANFVLQLLHLIAGTVRGLFQHDGTTGAASVQFWAVAATVLLLLKFAVGSIGPWFSSRRLTATGVRLLEILNYYAVNYTLGLMKPSSSSSSSHGGAVTANNFFQVWAVLITTMQDSIRIGRPYKAKEMSLIDLMSSLWSANQLRAPAPMYLKVPLWLMWSIHAARIIWYYFSFNRASDASLNNIKLVSDYMMTSQHTDEDACPRTMRGYKYIVFREDKQKMEVLPPLFTLEMNLKGPHAGQLVTLETIWKQGGDKEDLLLNADADTDNRFKDVCLSFALYKLQRRRFYNFPIAEATHPATSQLVSGNILEPLTEGDDQATRQPFLEATIERAFRITEVELSFLQDLFYSKHAAVFARGFPYLRLSLSLLMTAAALYLVDAVRDIPSASSAVTGGARMTHGVFVTHSIIAVVVGRELWEVGIYVVSQWTKVWIIGRHMKLTKGLKQISSPATENPVGAERWYQRMMKWCQGMSWGWQRVMLDKVAMIMFVVVKRGRWRRQIRQYNIVMSALIRNKESTTILPSLKAAPKKFIARKVKLQREVAGAVFQSLKDLIGKIPSPAAGSKHPSEDWTEQMNKLPKSYFENAFGDASRSSSSTPPCIEDLSRDLEGETHKILVWHIATSHCQIKRLRDKEAGEDLYNLPISQLGEHYVTAVSLSNYCAYLVTEALVPDNGLVVNKVFQSVRDEVRDALEGCTKITEIHNNLALATRSDEATILKMGTQLSEKLMMEYICDEELWKRLAKFWAGFLLHLSASTRAAKHLVHLQGHGELTTHLWVLLSHAGFLGDISHGEQLPDPVDQMYA